MLVVGLGNPGKEYIGTRHNVGRDTLIEIMKSDDFSEWKADRYVSALVAEGTLHTPKEVGGEPKEVLLRGALPETFMNRSGESVSKLLKKYHYTPEQMVLMYDDIDLPIGKVRISKNRGDGGHNGVRSVAEHLGSKDFVRIRIGICPVTDEGSPQKPHKDTVSPYVLGHFSSDEKDLLREVVSKVARSITLIAFSGVGAAMNQINEK